MAWIESHADLENHPKTRKLKILMGWDLDTTLSKLHRFWWFCIRYAEDGDLRRFNDAEIADAIALDSNCGKQFIDAMVQAGFIDREPFFRVHGWLNRVWRYLALKYHTSNPQRLEEIKAKYQGERVGLPEGLPVGDPKDSPPFLSLPNQTKPNQKNLAAAPRPRGKPPEKTRHLWTPYLKHIVEDFKRRKRIEDYTMSSKHIGILAHLYDCYRPERVMALWDLYWERGKPWSEFAQSRGHALEVFASDSMINQLLDDATVKGRERAYEQKLGTDAGSALGAIGALAQSVTKKSV